MKVMSSTFFNTILTKTCGCNLRYISRASLHSTHNATQQEPPGSSEPLVRVDHYNAITLLGLNRPDKRNALNAHLINVLRKELQTFQANESSSVAILYGTGGNFCSGLDLESFMVDKPSIPLIDEFCCKPVVAHINGYAVGEGFDLAMACDVRIMDDQAILGTFNRRFGVPMSVSALRRLSASAGLGFSLDITLSGRPIAAAEALQRGLVQQLAPCGSGKGNSITYAQSLSKFPQEALRADRAALFDMLRLSDEFQKAVDLEISSSLPLALKRMQSECQRFSEGIGKHGSFKNLTKQEGWPEWMK